MALCCVSLFVASLLLMANVCYDKIGCFSNEWPFWNTFGILPRPPEENEVTFHLYTRINPTNDQVLEPNGAGTSVMSTNFNGSHTMVFIIHGLNEERGDDWIKRMTSALIQYFDVNVIVVSWKDKANDNYFRAVANTRVVDGSYCQHDRTITEVEWFDLKQCTYSWTQSRCPSCWLCWINNNGH